MTTKEEKLLELFRSMNETRQDALMLSAEILSKYADPDPVAAAPAPDPVPVQTSFPDPEAERIAALGRKLTETAHKAKVPPRYQLVAGELYFLHDLMLREHDPFNALARAFDYGFVKGSRATRRGLVKAI